MKSTGFFWMNAYLASQFGWLLAMAGGDIMAMQQHWGIHTRTIQLSYSMAWRNSPVLCDWTLFPIHHYIKFKYIIQVFYLIESRYRNHILPNTPIHETVVPDS
jgi:hypothetical protein